MFCRGSVGELKNNKRVQEGGSNPENQHLSTQTNIVYKKKANLNYEWENATSYGVVSYE